MGLTFDSLFREATTGPKVFDRVYGPSVTFNGSTSAPVSEHPEATAEPGTHKNLSGADKNNESSDFDSLDDEHSDINYGLFQARQSKQESRGKFLVHTSWGN